MTTIVKDVSDIVPTDFETSPVWEFVYEQEFDSDTMMTPVFDLPVDTLGGRIAGTQVRLANGRLIWSTICNVDNRDALKTSQYITLSLFKDKWFHLARYFDVDFNRRGPAALAEFLGLRIEDIFPIAYDLRAVCTGNPDCLTGTIGSEPFQRLSDSERSALSFRI